MRLGLLKHVVCAMWPLGLGDTVASHNHTARAARRNRRPGIRLFVDDPDHDRLRPEGALAAMR